MIKLEMKPTPTVDICVFIYDTPHRATIEIKYKDVVDSEFIEINLATRRMSSADVIGIKHFDSFVPAYNFLTQKLTAATKEDFNHLIKVYKNIMSKSIEIKNKERHILKMQQELIDSTFGGL